MNASAKKIILFCVTLMLIGGTASALAHIKNHRKLGNPGVRAEAVPGSTVMKISFPENVPDFTSSNLPTPQVVLDYLPKDTSYAQRLYMAADGTWINANMILMGVDRTSIHQPENCLPGQGWQIVRRDRIKIPIGGKQPYDLPVQSWVARNLMTMPDGKQQNVSLLYTFWFVADGHETDDYRDIQKLILHGLFHEGVLQRWAYVSYATYCYPGQEDAALARVKNLIASSAPEFQLPLKN